MKTWFVVLGVLFVALPVSAQRPAEPYTARSLTMQEQVLRIDVGRPDRALLQWRGLNAGLNRNGGGFHVLKLRGQDPYFDFAAGAAYSLTDAFEFGGVVFPLRFAGPGRRAFYGDPSIYARFRFISGDFEMAAQATVVIPADTYVQFAGGLPMKLHLGERAHLNFGVLMNVGVDTRGRDDRTDFLVTVPVEFAFNVSRQFFFGFASGFTFYDNDLDLDNDSAFRVPSTGFVGYTASVGRNAAIDFALDFGFPAMVVFGNGDAEVSFRHWQAIFGANIYLDVR